MMAQDYLEKLLDKFDFEIEISYDHEYENFNYILKQVVRSFKSLDDLKSWIIEEFEEK